MSAPHVILACDKFKGSLTAAEVADALARGIHEVVPEVPITVVPVADGGDGTLDAAVAAGFIPQQVAVAGPTGDAVESRIAFRGSVTVVELADTCGLLRLPDGQLAPLTASSRGLGEAIAAALETYPKSLVIGVGGSASTDGGAGMLAALGVRLLDADGHELPDGGGALAELAELDLSELDPRLAGIEIVLASDVNNPLTGPEGAAAVFAPQKGASPEEVRELDSALAHFGAYVTKATGRDDTTLPGAGAAGGVGYAAQAVLGATMHPGIEVVLEWSEFAARAKGAALVVTGEGSLDAQTLLGKTPAGVAAAASAAGVRTVAVCGRSLLSPEQLADTAIEAVYALTDIEPDPKVCMAQADPLVERLGRQVATDYLR